MSAVWSTKKALRPLTARFSFGVAQLERSAPLQRQQRPRQVSAANSSSMRCRNRKKPGSCSNAWHTSGVSWLGNRRLPRPEVQICYEYVDLRAQLERTAGEHHRARTEVTRLETELATIRGQNERLLATTARLAAKLASKRATHRRPTARRAK
jgi:hypothetical protein